MSLTQIAMWYAITVKTNCEKKVQADLLQMIRNYGLQNTIFSVVVPETEEQILKKGVPTTVHTVSMKGYVFIKCKMNSDIWYLVRNSSKNVLGFLGSDKAHPTPLSKKNVEVLEAYCEPKVVPFTLEKNDTCVITNGAWKNSLGVITSVDHQAKTVMVEVELFQKKVPLVLSFAEVDAAS